MTKLLIYSFTVLILIIISLILIKKYVKEEKTKDNILKIFALITVILHYSSLWVDYFTTGEAKVDSNMLLPIYPCNICMWMLLIVAFMKNKKGTVYKILSEFLALGGTVCGLIGLFFNEIFLSNPDFLDYDSLKGLLSHTTMIFGTMFLVSEGFAKIRTISMTLSNAIGLLIFALIGAIVNTLFYIFNLDPVNAMYMLEFPFDIPGASFITLGIVGVISAFIITSIYELIFLTPSDRWYNNLKKHSEV